MSRLPSLLVLLPVLALAALPSRAAAQAPGYKGPDARQLRAEYRAEVVWQMNQLMADWAEAWGKDDVDALARLYTDEAVVFPAEGGEPIRGSEAIRAWIAGAVAGQGNAEAYLQDFEASGGMAMAQSTYRIRLTGGGSTRGEATGQMITILLLQGNRWRIRSQIFLPG